MKKYCADLKSKNGLELCKTIFNALFDYKNYYKNIVPLKNTIIEIQNSLFDCLVQDIYKYTEIYVTRFWHDDEIDIDNATNGYDVLSSIKFFCRSYGNRTLLEIFAIVGLDNTIDFLFEYNLLDHSLKDEFLIERPYCYNKENNMKNPKLFSRESYLKYCTPYQDKVILDDPYNIDIVKSIANNLYNDNNLYNISEERFESSRYIDLLDNDVVDFAKKYIEKELNIKGIVLRDWRFNCGTINQTTLKYNNINGRPCNIEDLLRQIDMTIIDVLDDYLSVSIKIEFTLFDVFNFNCLHNITGCLIENQKIPRSWKFVEESKSSEYYEMKDADILIKLNNSITELRDLTNNLIYIRETKNPTGYHDVLSKSCANLHNIHKDLYKLLDIVNTKYYKGE